MSNFIKKIQLRFFFIILGLHCFPLVMSGCESLKDSVNPTLRTPKGLWIDPTNNEVDLAAIDCILDRVEECLIRKFGSNPFIPDDLKKSAQCSANTFQYPIARERLVLKIPDEIPSKLIGEDWQPIHREGLGWHLNCDGTQQVLTIAAGSAGCIAKGKTPTNSCPCLWRANMIDDDLIVTTPSLYLLSDWYIRWATGCKNPWGNEVFAECANPITDPLETKVTSNAVCAF